MDEVEIKRPWLNDNVRNKVVWGLLSPARLAKVYLVSYLLRLGPGPGIEHPEVEVDGNRMVDSQLCVDLGLESFSSVY